MKKEKLTLEGIQYDLKRIAHAQRSNHADRQEIFIVPLLVIAAYVGIFWKAIWLALVLLLPAAYLIYRYVILRKEYVHVERAINETLDRGDISISVEKLSHVANEVIYQPHHSRGILGRGRHTHLTKEVTYYYFINGGRWMVPSFSKHYEWSGEFYMSKGGLANISLSGDEFFYVTLQGYHEISYVYPCKIFALDEALKQKEQAPKCFE